MPKIHETNHPERELLKTTMNEELSKLFDDNQNIKWNVDTFHLLFDAYLTSLLKTEFELFIGNSSNNSRNGYRTRTIKTLHGEIEVEVPRDRNGEFKSKILTSSSPITEELSKSIIKLYQLGLSNNDVCSYINDIYGVTYSKSSISNVTSVTSELVSSWRERPLSPRYIALFLDATYIPIKFEDQFEKQALHLVVAINMEGHQEILGYHIGFKETLALWGDVLDDIKRRGVRSVDICASDGFVGLGTVIKQRFPEARVQRCSVHLLRNLLGYVSKQSSDEIIDDFRDLFNLTTRSSFEYRLSELKVKWAQYDEVISRIFDNPDVSAYLDFPSTLHRTIKTTNRIEAVNQKIKTRIRFKQNFPNQASFERILVSSLMMQNKSSTRVAAGVAQYIKDNK